MKIYNRKSKQTFTVSRFKGDLVVFGVGFKILFVAGNIHDGITKEGWEVVDENCKLSN